MSREQRAIVRRLVRDTPLDFTGELTRTREVFARLQTATPLADDIRTATAVLGGVPVITIDIEGVDSGNVILYFHGGGYVAGSASGGAALAAEVARRSGARAILVEYRLAPEHPYPAAVEDAIAAYRAVLDSEVPASSIAVVGESAGGGLALATLLAAEEAGLPQPAAAYVMSPWTDLTMTGDSVDRKADVDPALTPWDLRACSIGYAAGTDPAHPLISPLFGDLAGLPPLLVQVGSHEILLDDATRFTARAAAADVSVTLEVTAEVPHVFQGMSAILDEAGAALDRAGSFLRFHWRSEQWAPTEAVRRRSVGS